MKEWFVDSIVYSRFHKHLRSNDEVCLYKVDSGGYCKMCNKQFPEILEFMLKMESIKL